MGMPSLSSLSSLVFDQLLLSLSLLLLLLLLLLFLIIDNKVNYNILFTYDFD